MKLVLEILNIETVRDAFKVGHIADSERKKVDEHVTLDEVIV
jgi:hypothetical protein